MLEETKKPWASKTLLLNFFVSLGMLLPWEGAKELMSEGNMVMILSVVNIVLRLVTKEKISLNA